MKLLHTSLNLILVDRIRKALTEREIPHLVRNEKLVGQAAGEVPPAVCWPEIFVRNEEDYRTAKVLVDELMTPPTTTGLAWICPHCHERLEPQFKICWACQGEQTEA